MYLHLELKVVPNARQTEAIARLNQLHGLMHAAPGFIDAQIARYQGNPTQYLVIRTWQDAEAHKAYRQSPAQKEFGANRVEGLYDNLLVQEWDLLLETNGMATGNFLIRNLYQVTTGRWDDFIADRKRHDAANIAAGGVQYLRTYRCLSGNADPEHEALGLVRRVDRDAYNAYLEGPDRAEYQVAKPAGLFTSTVTECYEIVSEHRK